MAGDQRSDREPVQRTGLEVVGGAGAHRTAQHQGGELGPQAPGDRRPAGVGRSCDVPVLLDATFGTG